MDTNRLEQTAQQIVADGKGILAADESTPTCTKRFEKLGIKSTPDTRRDYRQTLFEAEGIERAIGGVILFDETIRQESGDRRPLRDILAQKGVLPGIKVDTGAKPLALHAGEKVTEGLDGLRERLEEYAGMGARFAKWRAVIRIDPENGLPSRACQVANAHGLARYAALCQEAGLVPIVEPEVLMDGDHDIATADRVHRETWQTVFQALHDHDVHLPGILLKPSMVLSGKDAAKKAPAKEVADRTVAALLDHVPASVPGVVFLSGGQSPEEATEHLRLMNEGRDLPWALSFSYGRALQEPALAAWNGDNANRDAAQRALQERCEANRAAARGRMAVAA